MLLTSAVVKLRRWSHDGFDKRAVPKLRPQALLPMYGVLCPHPAWCIALTAHPTLLRAIVTGILGA